MIEKIKWNKIKDYLELEKNEKSIYILLKEKELRKVNDENYDTKWQMKVRKR
jgi:hypothetical protein